MGQQDIGIQQARVSARETEEQRLTARILKLTQQYGASSAEVERLKSLLSILPASSVDETSPTEDRPVIFAELEQRVGALTDNIQTSTTEASRLGVLREEQQAAQKQLQATFKSAATAKQEKQSRDQDLATLITEKEQAHTNLNTNIKTTWPQHLRTLKNNIYPQLCFDGRRRIELPKSGDFEGAEWYFPKHFPLDSLKQAMPSLEDRFTIANHHTVTWDEFKAHSESSVGGWNYRSWDNSESPRKLLLTKVKVYMGELEKLIAAGPDKLEGLSGELDQYRSEKQSLQAPLSEAKALFTAKQAELQNHDLELKKTTSLETTEIEKAKKLTAELRLVQTHAKPLAEVFHHCLAKFDKLTGLCAVLGVTIDGEEEDLAADVDTETVTAALVLARSLLQIYEEKKFNDKRDAVYADRELNLIEGEDSFKHFEVDTLEVHQQHVIQLPKLIAKLELHLQQLVIAEESNEKKLAAELKLVETHEKPLFDTFYDCLGDFTDLQASCTQLNITAEEATLAADLDVASIQTIHRDYEQTKAAIKLAERLQTTYSHNHFVRTREAIYSDGVLDLIEYDEPFQSFKTKALEVHYQNQKQLPGLLEKLSAHKARLGNVFTAKKTALGDTQARLQEEKKTFCEDYLGEGAVTSRPDVPNEGYLQHYIDARNDTYASWDWFQGAINWVCHNILACIPACANYQTDKSRREAHVGQMKTAMSTWRDSGDSASLAMLLAEKGTFSPRTTNNQQDTYQYHLNQVDAKVNAFRSDMPTEEEMGLTLS